MVVEKYLKLRSELGIALGSLITLAQQIGAPSDVLRNLRTLAANLNQPFLFVVVGEVKAGKSSMLNALFGRDFCKVDVLRQRTAFTSSSMATTKTTLNYLST
jgi:predicted GTPase